MERRVIGVVGYPLILLHAADNVLVAGAPVRTGDPLLIDGQTVACPADVPLGHKLARRDLHPGDTVLKYGAPIGAITAPVALAAHVHTHNMRSNYIPSHSREAVGS